MRKKLSEINFALVFFTLMLILSVGGMIELQSVYHSSYTIYASKLSDKPSSYYVLENPDKYVLEAMSTQNSVHIGSPQDTQLNELVWNQHVSNLEYNGTYYSVGCFFDTNPAPAILTVEVLLGIVLSASAIAIVASMKNINRFRLKR